jgi:hypothetical protein
VVYHSADSAERRARVVRACVAQLRIGEDGARQVGRETRVRGGRSEKSFP